MASNKQFVLNQNFVLRAVSLYDRGHRAEGGETLYKVGEPSQPGIKYPDGTEVTALGTAKGLGWIVRFPGGELGYADTNKILGNEDAYVNKKGVTGISISNGKVAAAADAKLDPIAELAAAKKALEEAQARFASAKKNLQAIAAAAAELELTDDELGIPSEEQQA